jgi:PKD domain
MTMDLHIVRKTVIGVCVLMALMAELTIFATAASAQVYAASPASASSPVSAGSAINPPSPGMATPPLGSVAPNMVPPNPNLLAVPLVGTAPLTVDFYVGLPNVSGSLIYAWNFGDGIESYLPAEPYLLHVYQNPGTYMCEVELVTAQGTISTTAVAKITVKPREVPDSVSGNN